jgi:hypothetical protein
MSIDSMVANTGPVSATMAAMELDMAGPGGVFGRLQLPEVITKSSGTEVKITEQEIKVTNMDAFVAFNHAIMNDESLILKLENGKTTIKAFIMKANITYAKDVHLKGMNGPKTIISKTEVSADGKSFTNTLVATNPSPLEIDLGTAKQEIRNGKGEVIAEQKGKVYLKTGETTYTMSGTTTGVPADGEVKIVAMGVEEENWNNLTLTSFSMPVTPPQEFLALCKPAAS